MNKTHDITVDRKEANFDRACEEAMREAVYLIGSDALGEVPVTLKFVGYKAVGTPSDTDHIYEFEAARWG